MKHIPDMKFGDFRHFADETDIEGLEDILRYVDYDISNVKKRSPQNIMTRMMAEALGCSVEEVKTKQLEELQVVHDLISGRLAEIKEWIETVHGVS